MSVAGRPHLLTTREAAELLRLRESTLRDHTRRGQVPHIRIGRQIRYDADDLAAWLDSIKHRPGEPE